MKNSTTTGAGGWRVWLRAVRAFSFTASLTPVLLGAMTAWGRENVRWELLPLVALGMLLLHAGSNLVSDAADYKRGVDRPGAHGGSGVILEGLLTARQVFSGGMLLLGLGAALGLVMAWQRGLPVLWLGLIGVLGGFGYGGKPFGFKYVALGDLIIFLLFGPLVTFGTHFVLLGELSSRALLISLPIACLVTAIVNANNLRDIATDSVVGIKTLATLIGWRLARLEYFLLVTGAYALTLLLVAKGLVSAWGLLAFLSLPLAARNLAVVARGRPLAGADIATVDVDTAKLHLVFGVLLSFGVLGGFG